MKALKATTEGREILQIQLQEQTPPTVSRKEDGRYTYAIRICAAQLVGELEAAAVWVPAVIQFVAKHVFSTEIDLKDLPKKTSVFGFFFSAGANW